MTIMMNELKRKIGDTVLLHEKFGKEAGKEAIIDSIDVDKKTNRQWYRLRYNGKLDPWNWNDSDFKQ